MIGKTKSPKPVKDAKAEAPTVVTNSPEKTSLGEPKFNLVNDVTIDDLLEFIKGPDFPTAGSIYDMTEIKSAYVTWKSRN
jgi:DNA gyrase subunit A